MSLSVSISLGLLPLYLPAALANFVNGEYDYPYCDGNQERHNLKPNIQN